MLFISRALSLAIPPDIKVITHDDCIYSKALKTLLTYSGSKFRDLDAMKHMNLIKQDKHVPKVFLNGRLIGGYQASLLHWKEIFQKLPEPPENLKNPDYVVSKYSNLNKK